MVRHNNMIPNAHFHKNWRRHLRFNFKQPFSKRKREQRRIKKAKLCAPRPIGKLRPVVHCPTSRYKSKIRTGRGFSLYELKAAGLSKKMVKTVGIAVDNRRRNRSMESLQVSNLRNLKKRRKYN